MSDLTQKFDYDNFNLPDPDKQEAVAEVAVEEEVVEEEVVEEEVVEEEVVEEKVVEEVIADVEKVEENPVGLFDISAETSGVISSLEELKEVSQVLSDPFFKKMYDYYKQEGNVKPFLEANSVDYSKMSDVQLLKMKHQEEYKELELSQDVIDQLFQEEVLDKFSDLEEDSLEGRVAKAKLKKEANIARSAFINRQNEFMAPALEGKPKVSDAEAVKQRNEQRKFVSDQLKTVIKDNKLSVEVAEGADALSVNIDPSKIIDAAIDPMTWISKAVVNNGQTDWNKLSQLVAFSNDPHGFIQNLYKHGNSLGQKKFVEKNLKNKTVVSGRKPTNSLSGLDPYSLEAFRAATKVIK